MDCDVVRITHVDISLYRSKVTFFNSGTEEMLYDSAVPDQSCTFSVLVEVHAEIL